MAGMAYSAHVPLNSGDAVITCSAACSFCSMYTWVRPSLTKMCELPMYLAQIEPVYRWQVPAISFGVRLGKSALICLDADERPLENPLG